MNERPWAGVAEAYRTSFATLCAGTIEPMLAVTEAARAAEGGGEIGCRHLDVGCGTGELALAASRAGRSVLAVDPDEQMAAAAEETAGPADVEVAVAGAPELPFAAASFDVVTANFVVNHVPDPRATTRELARVVSDGGVVAMTIWPAQPGPHLAAVGQAAKDCGAEPVPSTRLDPALDFPRSVDGLSGLAAERGLAIEDARVVQWTWRISADALMAGIRAGIAGPGRLYTAQTPQMRTRLERRIRELWSEHADGDHLAFPAAAAMVSARPAGAG